MASAGTSLRFSVVVAADQAEQALKTLTTAFNQAGVSAKTSMAGIAPAAKAAGAEIITLGDRMRNFAREQRAESRTAGFFVQELAQVVPMSGDIKAAIGSIGAAIVGGAGLATAIGLATAGIGLLMSRSRDAAAAVEAFAKQSGAAIDDLDKRIDALRNKTGAGKALEEWRLLQMQVDERRALIEVLKQQNAAEEALPASLSNDVLISQNRERIAQAEQEIFQLDRRAEKLREVVRLELGNADSAKAMADAERDAAKSTEDRARAAEKAAAAAEKEHRAKFLTSTSVGPGAGDGIRNQSVGVGDFAAPNDILSKGKSPKSNQAAYNAEVQRSIDLNRQWGDAIGTAVGALATGQMTARQALVMVLQTAIKTVTAHAIEAASGAAASQSAIPVVGPVLAISAMGAMLSTVIGLLGSMPSARGGWDVPAGWNGLAMIHEREMVLPQREADAIRSGSGGGITVNVGGVIDGRNFERAMTANDGPLARAQRKNRRRRRG